MHNKCSAALSGVFAPKVTDEIVNEIDKANIRNVKNISLLLIIYELLTYTLAIAGTVKVDNLRETTESVFFIIAFCLFFYIYSRKASDRDLVSHKKITAVTVVAFTVLSAYSMRLSYYHYVEGKDIITFFIVMVTFTAFIMVKPYISLILLLSSFTLFYITIDMTDGTPSIHIYNYFALAAICCVASASKYHLMLKQQLAQQETKTLNLELEKALRHDVLTKLKNRYSLLEDSVNYFDKPIYLVMCDCDNFKHINDTYGHVTGDKVISEVAQVFKNNIDPECVYRFGGDEFLIVNVDIDKTDFEALKKQIHSELDAISIEDVDEIISCSFGRAKGIARNGADFEELIYIADTLMYEEKQRKKQNISEYKSKAKPSKGGDAKQGV